MERYTFWEIKQKEGETVVQFVNELKTKAKNCEFGDQINLMIRDRIIFGIKDEQIKERLLRESENPTLERVIDMCRAAEISKQQIKTLQGEIPVDVIKKKQSQTRKFKENKDKSPPASGHINKKQSQKQTECKKCGIRHNPKNCPAYGKRCNTCKKLNHFSKKCYYKKELTSDVSDDECDADQTFFFVEKFRLILSKKRKSHGFH